MHVQKRQSVQGRHLSNHERHDCIPTTKRQIQIRVHERKRKSYILANIFFR